MSSVESWKLLHKICAGVLKNSQTHTHTHTHKVSRLNGIHIFFVELYLMYIV